MNDDFDEDGWCVYCDDAGTDHQLDDGSWICSLCLFARYKTLLASAPGPALKAFIDMVKPIVAKLDDRAAVTCKASQLRELIAELEADDEQ